MSGAAKKAPVVRGPQASMSLADKCEKCGNEIGMHDGTKCPPKTAAFRKAQSRAKKNVEHERLEVRAGFAQLQGGAGNLPVHQTLKDTETQADGPMRWSAVPTIELPAELPGTTPQPQQLGPDGRPLPPTPQGPQPVTAALPQQAPTPQMIAGAEKLASYLLLFWSFGGAAAKKLIADLEASPPPARQAAVHALLITTGKQAIEHWDDKIVLESIHEAGVEFALKYKLTAAVEAVKPPCEAVVAGAILVPALAIGANVLRARKKKQRGPVDAGPAVHRRDEDDDEDDQPRRDEAVPHVDPNAWAAYGDIPGGNA